MTKKHRIPVGDQEVDELFQEFQGESDRACAVLAGSYLDTRLEELLAVYMIDGPGADQLFAPEMPLGSFGAKIRLAHCLGLISEAEHSDLHRIRRIRNDFAHRLHGLSFQSQSIFDRCRSSRMIAMDQEQGEVDYDLNDGRTLFSLTFAFLDLRLALRKLEALKIRRSPPNEYTFSSHDEFQSLVAEIGQSATGKTR